MNITVVGIGYVGISNAILLAQNNKVIAFDISDEKVNMINKKQSMFEDEMICEYMNKANLDLIATTDSLIAYRNAECIFICAPTNYDDICRCFDTSIIDNIIKEIVHVNKEADIVIKSTVPIGYTKKVKEKFNKTNIIFSPEFLREGYELYDNLYPSRIVVGDTSMKGKKIADLLLQGAIKKDVHNLLVESSEAEAIKLFSNTYLALRVAFYNEIDTFCEINGLLSHQIIEGMGFDSRIGNHYNNPSFGYGGYCLPKDSKQLLSNFNGVDERLITAVIESNEVRKNHIANRIISKFPKVVGIYRLIMKKASDNIREAAIIDIIKLLKDKGVKIVIYEPIIEDTSFMNYEIIFDIEDFKKIADIIVANRVTTELEDVMNKVYTRDLFYRD